MHRTNNVQAKNLPTYGNILDSFKALNDIIPPNDGTRSFIQLSTDAYDQPMPISGENTETTIKITHPTHQVSQINDSFLLITEQVTIQIPQLDATNYVTTDVTGVPVYFFGYKSSNQMFRQMKIIHNGVDTEYLSQESIREGFAYSNLKPSSEKIGKKGIHTTYDSVISNSPEVCGVYIPATSFKNSNKSTTVTIKTLVPISDLIALQAFSLYPSNLIGELALKVIPSTRAMVWCQVPPQAVLDAHNYMNNTNLTLLGSYASSIHVFDRFFHQIGDSGNVVDVGTGPAYIQNKITPIVTNLTVTHFRAQLMGFGVKSETYNAMAEYLRSQPIILPAQQLEYFQYSTVPDPSGINASMQIKFDNVECLTLMFPTSTNQLTVFTNPNIQNLQMNIDDKLFPPNAISTNTEISPEFLVYQLNASDLDGCIEPTKSWLYSITQPRHNTSGTRFPNTIHDNTDFMCNFSLERSQGGSVFDGFNTANPVNVKLQFNPVYSGNNDMYYIPDSTDTALHSPAPQVWLCKDTYWVLGLGEVHYVNKGAPK